MTILRRQHTVPLDGLLLEILGDGNGIDTSGNGYHATPSNLSYSTATKDYQQKIGTYNGSSSYMQLPTAFFSALAPLSQYSFCFHFKTGATSSQYLNTVRIEGKQYMGIYVNENPQRMYFQINDSTGTGRVGFINWVANTEYIVFGDVYSGGLDLYVNGVKQTIAMTGGASTAGISNGWIGRESAGYYWNGNIGAIRFWNRRLTQDERESVIASHNRILGSNKGLQKTNPSSTIPGSPVARYNFDSGNANDSIGTLHGTASSVTFGSSNQGQGATFNGTSSYITLPQSAVFDITTGTMIFQLRFNSIANVTDACIFDHWDETTGSGNYAGLALYYTISSGVLSFRLRISNGGNGNVTDNIISVGTIDTIDYHTFAFTISGTTTQIYFDGVLVSTKTDHSSVNYSTNPTIHIGANKREYDGTITSFSSILLDDFIIWNTVLSGSSIQGISYMGSIWNNTCTTEEFYENLEFLYNGKNASNSVYDQSGKGIVGTASSVSFGSQNAKGLIPMTFNGSSSGVNIGNPTFLQQTGSKIMVTILARFSSTANQFLFCKGNDGQGGWGFGVWITSGVLKTSVVTTSPSIAQYDSPGYTPETGKYYIIQGYWDPTTQKVGLYVNGVFQGETSTGATLRHGGNSYIGTFYNSMYTNGDILFLAGHSKILTTKQCRRIFTSLFLQ